MINLRTTNSQLLIGAKYSYLNDNIASGVSSIDIDSITGFTDEDYLLLESFGNETAEIVQINGAPSGSSITLVSATKFAHSESTKVTILKYNQVKYYHTATAVFATDTLLGTLDIQADSLHTVYSDIDNPTGFGWFVFYNLTVGAATGGTSQNSNAIPYSDFNKASANKILKSFFSILNAKERRIITEEDGLRYLNQAYSIVTNELNLVSSDYNVSDEVDIAVVANTKEYDLEDDFSDVVSIFHDDDNIVIDFIDISDVPENDELTTSDIRYYLRGNKIGFSPTPSSDATVKMRYKKNSTDLENNYENIDLPENNYFIVVDYMIYLAKIKLNDPRYMDFYKIFKASIDSMKLSSFKRSNAQDSWGIDYSANI